MVKKNFYLGAVCITDLRTSKNVFIKTTLIRLQQMFFSSSRCHITHNLIYIYKQKMKNCCEKLPKSWRHASRIFYLHRPQVGNRMYIYIYFLCNDLVVIHSTDFVVRKLYIYKHFVNICILIETVYRHMWRDWCRTSNYQCNNRTSLRI